MSEEGRNATGNLQPAALQLFPVLSVEGKDLLSLIQGFHFSNFRGRNGAGFDDVHAIVVRKKQHRSTTAQRAAEGPSISDSQTSGPTRVPQRSASDANPCRHEQRLLEFAQRYGASLRCMLERPLGDLEA
jgi:hypothetical protein